MAAWPSSLPQYPLATQFSEVSRGGLIVTEMDAGPPKRRRRYTAEMTRFNYGLVLTETQVNTLETFWETTLSMGVDAFDWVHPRTKSAASLAFVTRPTYVPAGAGYWTAQFNLDLML